ncbi:hypothetical protein Q7C_1578 [Methylophaga frappieri]|uniref:Uncharacterized protein n=1 Tax=Methylophaga frappieri (strain ATCC BAA-2434 / DSM 25690 / JAM7) TaxID=754477 RepID=I1YII4_METFJ|nr:hypothetical protein [Methylophaga frappieri]AFJ02727.1 hypothetical protein Q7C_1578 [Methylophaga frappieri]
MTRYGDSIERIQATLTLMVWMAILFLPLSLQAATLEEKRATRLERMGVMIGRSDNYEVYSNQAEFNNGKAVCSIGLAVADRAKAEAEFNTRQEALRLAHEPEERRIQQALTDIGNTLRSQKLSGPEVKRLTEDMARLMEENKDLKARYLEQTDAIDASRNAAISKAGATKVDFNILHTPSHPTQTILPFSGDQPDNRFIKSLNDIVSLFLGTCGKTNGAYSSHYYKNAFRYGESDKPVLSFGYEVENNRLNFNRCDTPACRAIRSSRGITADPQENPELTLAGFIKGELQKAESAGDYRKAFAYEAGRREGIVYKLDPYWGRYDGFDIARRIFEGEFGEYRNTPEFKAFYTGLAMSYSKRCKAHVKQWQTFERNYDAYEGTDHNLDGSRTIHTSEQTKTYRIDARFGAHWAQFDSDLNRAVLDQGIFQGFGLVLGLRGEMETFLKTHACDSATVRQMTDNFIRAANGQPSVQQAGLRFAGAATESDAPTKTGAPPPPFTPVANVQEENETVNAAVAAFGGGGLFGEDWKTPTMSEKEFNREVDHVTGEGQDNFNRAARDAEQSLDELEEATREAAQAQSQNRQNLEQRLIELIKERNQTPENSQRYNDLQNTIEFTMQHMGITEEPTVPSENRPPAPKTRGQSQQPQQDSARQATADRRQRIRQIDQETDKKVQALIQAQHQTQVEEAEVFMKQITTVSGPERTRLLKDYEQKQRAAGEQLREQVQALRAEANERKRQL